MAQNPNLVSILRWIYDVTLVGRLYAIEANAVMPAAHERNIFRVRPAKRHRRASRANRASFRVRQNLAVPNLLCDHAAFIRKVFDRGDERFWIAPRGQLVMAAFSGQNWPAATYACAVEGASVILLSVVIMVVSDASPAPGADHV